MVVGAKVHCGLHLLHPPTLASHPTLAQASTSIIESTEYGVWSNGPSGDIVGVRLKEITVARISSLTIMARRVMSFCDNLKFTARRKIVVTS
jgi:hypothetical protein